MAISKRIASNTGYLYLRTILSIAITLYTSRILLDALGAEDFGLYYLIAGFVLMVAFLKSSLASGAQRFLAYELGQAETSRLNSIFSTAITIHIIAALLFFILGETLGLWIVTTYLEIPSDKETNALWVYQFALIGLIFTLVTIPHLSLITANENIRFFALVTLTETFAKLGAASLLYTVEQDRLWLYGLLILLVNIGISMAYWIYCKKQFPYLSYERTWDKQATAEMSQFSAWTIVGNLAVVLSNHGSNVLLNVFFGPLINAAKAVSAQVETASASFSNNLIFALSPPIIKSYSSNAHDQTRELMYRGSKLSFMLMFLVVSVLLANTDAVLKFWLVTPPDYATIFTQLILLSSLINAFGRPLSAVAQATGTIKRFQIVVGGVQLLVLPLAYLMLSYDQPPQSVFYVILGVTAVAFGVRLWMLKYIFTYSLREFFKIAIGRCILVSALGFALMKPSFMTDLTGFLYLFVNVSIDILLVALLVGLIGLTANERGFIKGLVIRKRQS